MVYLLFGNVGGFVRDCLLDISSIRSNVRSFIASLAASLDETRGVRNRPRKIMAININDPETERLAREVAKKAGETLTEAIRNALQEHLQRLAARSAVLANGTSSTRSSAEWMLYLG
jgi:hypothetical protein